MELWVEWSDIKSLATSKYLPIQYVLIGNYYHIWLSEDSTHYRCRILKEVTPSTDQADFENNYKASANAPVAGRTVVQIANKSVYVTAKKESITGATDLVEMNWSEIVYLQGMVVMVKDADWGDYVDVEVGYYAPSWTPLKAFGKTVYMKDQSGWQEHRYENKSVSEIPTSLKVRLKYNQADTGTTKKVVLHYICQK